MASQALTEQLNQMIRGRTVSPTDTDYDTVRRVYNGMIDKHPNLIVQCVDVADVVATVNYARESGSLLAVRGGGHNGAGLGTCDDGIVLDLSLMKGIRVDPVERTVRAMAGCTQGEVEHATHHFGLAVPAGVVSSTGLAGLTLGGGHGYLARKYGLTVDNLLEADVVLADGRFVTANSHSNEDLFWAIRGGGGNFGVVTSFLFSAKPVDTVIAGMTFWDIEAVGDVARWYREYMPPAPEDLYAFLAMMIVPPAPDFPQPLHGRTVCGIFWCYLGSPAKAKDLIEPAHKVCPPLFEMVGPMPFPALQSLFDPLLPPGMQWYWKGAFVNELPDEAVAVHHRFTKEMPTPLSLMHLYPLDGAVHRVGPTDTPFGYRDAMWSMVIAGVAPDPADGPRITQWAKDYWKALQPYTQAGAYLNFMMDEGTERVRATYRQNYDRLVEVKRKYDPENLLRVNQNIKP